MSRQKHRPSIVLNYNRPMSTENRSRPSTLYLAIGGNISRFRKELSLSQAELAARLKVTQPHVASIETGKRRISIEDLFQVAEGLKIPVTALLPLEEDPKKPGPRPKLIVAYEKLAHLAEKDQGVILAMIDSLSAKTKE